MAGPTEEGREDAPKVSPESLKLRTRPRPVKRISRRALAVVSGAGLLLIFGATIFALDPPRVTNDRKPGPELHRPENAGPKPEGLEALPRSYTGVMLPAPEPAPINLGPPLPGDLGGAVLNTERALGIESEAHLPFRPSPEEDAARAERIRQARLAQQGRESGVFFQLSKSATGTGEARVDMPDGGTAANPLAAVAAETPGLETASRSIVEGSTADGGIYNAHALQDPVSPFQVMAGTIIAASLITGVNSDLPGQLIAQVTENVFDTVTGRHLLIPQGSRVIGVYNDVIAFGQERALIVWRRIIMPDGSSVVIDNLPATGPAGYAGLEDKVDFHNWRLLKGVVLSTVLGVAAELRFGDEEDDLARAIRESTQDGTVDVGARLTERNLDIEPTITIRPGWPLRIIVNKDLVLRPYQD